MCLDGNAREKTIYINGQIPHAIWWDTECGCWIDSWALTWRLTTIWFAGISAMVWRSNDDNEATDGLETTGG
jgi:hypothetical protein